MLTHPESFYDHMVNIVGLEGEGSPFVHNPRMKPWLTHLSRSVGYDLSESEGAKKKPPKAMPRGIIFCRAEAELQATYYKPDSSNGDCVLLCESLFYATAEAVAPENGGPWELDEELVELFKEEARKQNSCKVTRLLPIPNPLSNGIDLSSLDARFDHAIAYQTGAKRTPRRTAWGRRQSSPLWACAARAFSWAADTRAARAPWPSRRP